MSKLIDQVRMLTILEKACGTRATYVQLEPAAIYPLLPWQLEEATRLLAKHAGLQDVRFDVRLAELLPGQAGSHHSHGYFAAEIRLSSSLAYSREVLLASLCHEIAHSYVERYLPSEVGLQLDEARKEQLTDVAAVFMGFGKAMLRGCQVETREVVSTTVTTSGYLSPEDFASVYALVSSMRGQMLKHSTAGLSEEIRRRVETAWTRTKEVPVSRSFFDAGAGSSLEKMVSAAHQSLLETSKLITYLRAVIEAANTDIEKSVARLQAAFGQREPTETHDPVLRYLSDLMARISAAEGIQVAEETKKRVNRLKRDLAGVAATAARPNRRSLVKPTAEMFRVVKCPSCRQRLRLKADRDESYTCPKCKTQFRADSTANLL